MKSLLILFCCSLSMIANGVHVDIVSGFDLYELPISLENIKKSGYELRFFLKPPFDEHYQAEDPELKKILIFGWPLEVETLSKLPKEKLVFFLMEPWEMPETYYDCFSRIYTWNDAKVDNIKFFKLFYPHLFPMESNLPPFEEKRLCTMVSGSDNLPTNWPNELYTERLMMVEFFETKPEGEFDVYGRYWVKRKYRDFRGHIPGGHSGEEKVNTLKKYRFSICFENTKDLEGYITEKIFSCLTAGSIPVYWGASNITKFIPKNCFIDFRDFNDQEELYQYMKSISMDSYNEYLNNIRSFLLSPEAQVFAPPSFEKMIYEAITN